MLRMTFFWCAALLVLLLQVGEASAQLKANWVGNDVPKGGFSKRAREQEARRRGETYDDPYAYSSDAAYSQQSASAALRRDAPASEEQPQPQLQLP